MHSIRKAASRASGKSGFFSGKSKQTVERADLEEAPGRAAPPPPALRRALSEEGRELLRDALGARAQTSHQPGPHKLPSEMDASDFLCPISREIMTDPVVTVRLRHAPALS